MEEFIRIYNEYIHRDGADKLLEWLKSSDFFKAPSSTKYHGAFEGGLVQHSVNVFKRLFDVNRSDFDVEVMAIVSLLHDLCKVNFYKPEWKNLKVYSENGSKSDPGGKFEWETIQSYSVNDQLPYGHGEKSAYIVSGFMKLTREESMAIRWHMGGFDDSVKGGSYSLGEAFKKYPLALELHIADMRASYLDENNTKEEKQ